MSTRHDRRQFKDDATVDNIDMRGGNVRRKKRRWPYVLLLLVGITLFLPNVVTMLGLEQHAISMFTGDLNGTLKVGRTSAGWFQPLTLKNVSLIDDNQETVLSVAEVKSSKRLWSFVSSAFGDADYGHFEVRQPVVNLRLRQNGSNLEDVIANYLKPSADNPNATPQSKAAPAALPKISVNVIDGVVSISSVGNKGAWSVDQLNLNAQLQADAAAAVSTLQCRVTPFVIDAGGTPIPHAGGTLSVAAEVDPGQKKLTLDAIHAQIQSQSLPLSVLGPLAERFVGPTEAGGSLDCQLDAVYDLKNTVVQANVQSLNMSELQLASYELLGADRFQLTNAKANGNLILSPATLSAEQFEFITDVGQVRANGNFELKNVNQLAAGAQLPDADFQMNGQLDLAGLMQMLPATFHTHEDLQVQSGVARFQIASQQRQLLVSLDMADLKASRGGEAIVWQEPIRVVGKIADTPAGLALTNLQAQTDFINVQGNASFSEAVFGVQGDLGLLTQRVGQFVDLQSMDFAGTINGKFGWQLSPSANGTPQTIQDFTAAQDRPIDMIGSFVVTNPVIRMPGLPDWKQDQAAVQLEAQLNALANGQLRVDNAFTKADLGSEQVTLTLAGPVADALTQTAWKFNTHAVGDVSGYLRHVQKLCGPRSDRSPRKFGSKVDGSA